MNEKEEVFGEIISEIKNRIPINYQKAKLTFSNDMPMEKISFIKFIEIEKFNTKKAIVRPFYRHISKII